MEGQPISRFVFERRFSTGEVGTGYTLVEVTIEGGTCSPADIGAMQPPALDTRRGVILSMRGPVWAMAALVHHYHPYPWVATYDPRLGGVVVQSHVEGVRVGHVVDISSRVL